MAKRYTYLVTFVGREKAGRATLHYKKLTLKANSITEVMNRLDKTYAEISEVSVDRIN